MIKLDRVLFSPFHYPGDYGLIPQTLSEDGDPLDALVLVTNPTYPGILIEARPIGLLQMIDDEESDDKIICVSTNDPRYLHTTDSANIEDHSRSEIGHCFQVYKDPFRFGPQSASRETANRVDHGADCPGPRHDDRGTEESACGHRL